MNDLKIAVAKHHWFHQIDLGDGIVTPGPDDSKTKWEALRLPDDLSGKTVLDIGAWNGYFSFACEARGATVLATDHFCWGGQIDGKPAFDLAKKALGSQVGERKARVEDLDPRDVGTFDIVLFLGVLYHTQDPLGYLKKVRSLTKGFAVIETHVDMMHVDRPALAYYPANALDNDATNFFGPNELAVIGMCHDCGFSRAEVKSSLWGKTRSVLYAYA